MRRRQVGLMSSHLEKVRRFHDQDAPRYRSLRYHSDSCEGLAYVTRRELVLAALDNDSGDFNRVLDLGCGPGILTPDLLARNLKVYSADLSMEMIKEAKMRATASPLSGNAFFVASDVSEICFSSGKMDSVFCIGVVCYVRDYVRLLSEIHRVLKPGGIAIIQIDNIRWPSIYRRFVPLYRYLKGKISSKTYDGLDFDFNLFARQEFFKDLDANKLKILDLHYYDFRVPFVDILLPRLSVRFGSVLFENRSLPALRCLSHGLLIKCAKIDGHHSP
jgi:ubiquinone/menaquinone biosynthesis C-methylase UbiE